MRRGRRIVLGAGAAIAAAAVVGGGAALWRRHEEETAAAGVALMATRLPDLDGKLQPLVQWQGKLIAANFWATWCAPCRKEIPLFVRAQERYRHRGLQFIGIAIDDPAKVRAFAAQFKINYPVLLGTMDTLELARKAGNEAGGLPYTVFLGRDGRIAATELGRMTEAELEGHLAALL